MNRFASYGVLLFASYGVLLTALLVTTVAHAGESVGIPACDDFLTKYEACLAKVPEAQQTAYKTQIDKARISWAAAAKNPSAVPALEGACKSMAMQVQQPLSRYGCTF